MQEAVKKDFGKLYGSKNLVQRHSISDTVTYESLDRTITRKHALQLLGGGLLGIILVPITGMKAARAVDISTAEDILALIASAWEKNPLEAKPLVSKAVELTVALGKIAAKEVGKGVAKEELRKLGARIFDPSYTKGQPITNSPPLYQNAQQPNRNSQPPNNTPQAPLATYKNYSSSDLQNAIDNLAKTNQAQTYKQLDTTAPVATMSNDQIQNYQGLCC